MPPDYGFACIERICQAARMWCFLVFERLFSFTVAFGMATTAVAGDVLKTIGCFGMRRSIAISPGTKRRV